MVSKMIRNAISVVLPMVVLTACVDTSLLSNDERAAAQIGERSGQPVYEFTNEWDTRPAPRALKDTLLNRKAVRFCPDYQIISRTPSGTRPGPKEMVVGTTLQIPTTIASEKVRITCPTG